MATVLANANKSAEPAHVQVLERASPAGRCQRRAGAHWIGGIAGGLETLNFDVPGDDRMRTTLQVMFDRNHDVTDAQFRLLKAAAWLTAAVLELEKPAAPAERSAPMGLLAERVA